MTANPAIQGASLNGSVWEERQVEAQEAVGTHFQQHTGQDDRASGGCFGMGIRQPGVQREHGHFDGESQPKSTEQATTARWQG